MMFCINPGSIVSRLGAPLQGRVTFYRHDTDDLATIYTLEGQDFVQSANPQILDINGRLIDTVFFDCGIIDVRIEQYIGPDGFLSVDAPDEYFAAFDIFEYGIKLDNDGNAVHAVDTIADLKDVDVSMGVVLVRGYYALGDSPARYYVWDEDSDDSPDGGYVIDSNGDAAGKWILCWGDEILPCSVYGVKPGTESNISSLLAYPALVGSMSLPTAPCVRFTRGTYTSAVNFSTSKELCFDQAAKFISAKFTCPSVRVFGSVTDFIADFAFSDSSATARSSWFKTAKAFFSCGAGMLIADGSNFSSASSAHIDEEIACDNCTLLYETNTRLPLTYSGSGRVKFTKVNLEGNSVFDATDCLTFYNMTIFDKWWAVPSAVDWSVNVIARSAGLATLTLDNFKSTEAYINAVIANGETKIDLSGRHISVWNDSDITDIRNLYCDALTIHAGANNVTLHNVHAPSLDVSCSMLSIEDSDVAFASVPSVSSVTAKNSSVDSSVTWTTPIGVDAMDCFWGVTLDYVQDNESDHSAVTFKKCVFKTNTGLKLKRLAMYDCVTDNNAIRIYPRYDSVLTEYFLTCTLEGNSFNSNTPIEFTKIDEIDGVAQEDAYDCRLQWRIVNNSFVGNSEGLRMRYWQYRTGIYSGRTFVNPSNAAHDITYSGNTGNCPSETMRGVGIGDNTAYTTEDLGSGTTLYKYAAATKRAFPKFGTFFWDCDTIGGRGMMNKWYDAVEVPYNSLTYSVYVQNAWYCYFKATDDALTNGDFFDLGVCVFNDYIRIVQSGGGDKNTNVKARVV